MKVFVLVELLALAGAVYFCLLILAFPFGTPGYLVTPTRIEEALEVPLNSQVPVYTENKYSDWVAISISGSVERNGEFFHDAFHQYDDVQQGSQGGFQGFMIDGTYAYRFRAPSPDYQGDHVYRFQYPVFGNTRDPDARIPKTLGFQMINEAARGLDGCL